MTLTPRTCECTAIHPRYAMHRENELVPFPHKVMTALRAWLAQQDAALPPLQWEGGGGDGVRSRFTDEQRWWLVQMAEHIASNLGIEAEDFEYPPEELDRNVQTPDQIRTIARTLRDRWQSDLFPQRQELPKTLVFAKDDNHAEAIVGILREEWGRGNEFAQKITYRTTGSKPEELIKAFRTSYYPRIAVTVDMIASGTDIKPGEIVVFMRSVKSRSFFE